MKLRTCLLAASLAAAFSSSVFADSMSADEAEDLLMRRGFTQVSDLEYAGGLWTGTARNERGEIVDISIDPLDQKVTSHRTTTTTTVTTTPAPPPRTIVREVPVVVEKPVVVERVVEQPVVRTPIMVRERVLVPVGGRISRDDVRAVLSASGYHDIHDIDWLGNRGVWKAEARDPTGDDREIHLDPYDGSIVHVEDD
jgi:hypothetical protein